MVSGVNATDIFYDDFSTLDTGKWSIRESGGTVSVSGGVLGLGSTGFGFPYLINKGLINLPTDGYFNIRVRFRYLEHASMGDGIGIGFTGLNGKNFYQFGVWQDTNMGSVFYYHDFSVPNYYCFLFNNPNVNEMYGRVYRNLSLQDGSWNNLEIERIGSGYKVYVNKEMIYQSVDNQCIPKFVWLGNQLSGGRTSWNTLEVDSVLISDVPYVDPTPTQTPSSPKHKIIILPGLGASWNERAIVYDQSVADDEWKMTPFVGNYDGLVQALTAKGLQKDVDLYVWNYDWRKSINEIENKFSSFVNLKVGTSEKVDLVGHSLGGLVARMWGQTNKNDSRLGKIITLGSPHLGAVSAYDAWNGGKVSDKFDVASVAMNILLRLKKGGSRSNMEAIRNNAPVIADLLPVFNYVKRAGAVLPWGSLSAHNDYLNGKNVTISEIFANFLAVIGKGQSTKEWLELGERSIFDTVLGLWPDGKPVKYTSVNEGDGTVLKKSAKFDEDEFKEVASDHGEIVNKSINMVFEELGLGNTVAGSVLTSDWSKSLVFYIGSPADMAVSCDGATGVVDKDGFVIIKDNNFVKCVVTLSGTGNGVYHLVTGRSDNEDSWKYFEGGISTGETKAVTLLAKNGQISFDNSNIDYLYGLVKNDLEGLKTGGLASNKFLTAGLSAVAARNVNLVTDNVFGFRKEQKETDVTDRIIENLMMIMTIQNKTMSQNMAKSFYNRAVNDRSLLERMTRLYGREGKKPTVFGSVNYVLIEKLYDQMGAAMKSGSWAEAATKANFVSRLTKIVW